jgi:hypothetical protein
LIFKFLLAHQTQAGNSLTPRCFLSAVAHPIYLAYLSAVASVKAEAKSEALAKANGGWRMADFTPFSTSPQFLITLGIQL